VLASLSGTDALAILEVLAGRHPCFAEAIDVAAEELLRGVDIDDLAADVTDALELLQPEDVWDRSGRTRTGYVEPGDAAWELFEEALQPFRDDIVKYRKLSMLEHANLQWQGILKGIYDFDKESSTPYKDWATDAPAEYFGMVLQDWKSLGKGRMPLAKMQAFIQSQCPDYSGFAERILRSKNS
jgi:hypothetical protein